MVAKFFALQVANSSNRTFSFESFFDYETNHPSLLSNQKSSGLIQPNSDYIFFIPIDLELLHKFPSQAGKLKYISLCQNLEFQQNRRITNEEKFNCKNLSAFSICY